MVLLRAACTVGARTGDVREGRFCMAIQPEAYDVEFDHVSKSYGGVLAVDDLQLGIHKGEFFSLLGPSGCGKSTSLRMIAGFEQPSEGEILLNGEPVSEVPPYKRNVNMVFQDYALFPHLSIWENVAFGLRRKKVPQSEIKTRVEDTLKMVEMAKMADRKPAQLSGGQQQRVAVARALVNLPTVLLLDEPLGALDAKLRKSMQLELKRLQGEVGITFVYVTHDQEEALTMSDRIAIMNEGRVEQVGSPAEIYENPQSEFVANFIGVSNVYSAAVVRLDDDRVLCRTDKGVELLVARRNRVVSEGHRVKVIIRPEKLLVTAGGSDASQADNTYKARVATVVYVGSVTQLIVEIEGGLLARILLQNVRRAGRGDWQTGDLVTVELSAESCSLIAETDET
jgi:spermidine/putrescine transport system ATP-binding protein